MWSLRWSTRNAPFVPISGHSIKEIVRSLELRQGSVCYDLGCGDGRVLFAAHRIEPGAKYYGIDKHLFPYLLARLKGWHTGVPVQFRKEDVFRASFADATHLYTYLHTDFLNALLPKLVQELRPGTRMVSADFCFKDKKPVATKEFAIPGRMKTTTLYVYEF